MRLVVADTSPINYLLLIGHVDVLPALFEKVIVPEIVRDELTHPKAPAVVRNWITSPPEWVEIREAKGEIHDPALKSLDAGEEAGRSRIVAMRIKCTFPLMAFITVALVSAGSQEFAAAQDSPMQGVWVDSSTGLIWTRKDNGKDVSWRGAMKYCRALRLGGYSDWRLASAPELQGIYDKTAEAPGMAGYAKTLRSFTWHVKGSLFLTGEHGRTMERSSGDRSHALGIV